jgi:hypothetical protein
LNAVSNSIQFTDFNLNLNPIQSVTQTQPQILLTMDTTNIATSVPTINSYSILFRGEQRTIYRIDNAGFDEIASIFATFDDTKISNNINALKNFSALNPRFTMTICNGVHTEEYSIFMLACESANKNLVWTLLPTNLDNLNTKYIETSCGFVTTPFEVIIGTQSFTTGCQIILYARKHGISPSRNYPDIDLDVYTRAFNKLGETEPELEFINCNI